MQQLAWPVAATQTTLQFLGQMSDNYRKYHFCALRSLGDGRTNYNDGVIASCHPIDHPDFYDSIRARIASVMDPPCSPGQLALLSLTPLD